MTREEAIKWLEETIQDTDTYFTACSKELQKKLDEQREVFLTALTALRGPTREQVAKMRGEWEDVPLNMDASYFATKYNLRKKCTACKYVMPREWPNFKFCPACGSPMTDEAVDMVMERLEELK